MEPVFKEKYLTPDILKGFDQYKYSSRDTGPFSVYIMHPFWNQVVKLCPRFIAPNVLTFAGYMCLVLNFAVLSYYDLHFYASSAVTPASPVPNWVWLVCGISNLLSHTLDGIDGKQARRTGTSSPLGELFDHGIDSWATMFLPIALYSVFGREDYSISVLRFFLVLLAVQYVFIMSHFEKYNTGILFLPWGYDPSQIAMSLLYIVTFVVGTDFWKFHFPYIPIMPTDIFEVATYAGSLALSCPMTFYNIHKAHKEGTGPRRSLYEGLLPMLSVTTLFACQIVWVLASPSGILEAQPRLYFWLTGTVFSNIACRLIVSQMSSTRCDPFNPLVYPIVIMTSLVLVTPAWAKCLEMPFLVGYSIFMTVVHLHYGINVVLEMAAHFKINVFTITPKKD